MTMITPYQAQCLDVINDTLKTHPELTWIKPSYIMAHIQVECDWRPRVSTDGLGSLGPMQVLPETAREMGVLGSQAYAANSILAGMLYLNSCLIILYKAAHGKTVTLDEVTEAYNEGPGNVEEGRDDVPYRLKVAAARSEWAFVDVAVSSVRPVPAMPSTTEPLPTPCRLVLYCDPQMGDEYPAIITAVYGQTDTALTSFPVGQLPFPVRGSTPFNATGKPVKGQWRWPPRNA